MKLISYKATRPGFMGLGNVLIRWRLNGPYSHSEIVFEPGDDVDHLMPDRTCAPDAQGALWCASSTGLDTLPAWSMRRAGRRGGVRFKRVVIKPDHWDVDFLDSDPQRAARWAHVNQGRLYDWQLIIGFLAWLIPQKKSRVMCSEACAEMLGFADAWRFDPCILRAAVTPSIPASAGFFTSSERR